MFRFFALVLALSAVAYGGELAGRTIDGIDSDIGSVPWQLSLREDGKHFCGAALVSSTWAVSAASCTINRNASNLSLRAGTSNSLAGGQILPVHFVVNNDDYDNSTFDNDISLLRVVGAFILNQNVRGVGLPLFNDPVVGADLFGVDSGWGNVQEGDSSALKEIWLPIVPWQTCNDIYSDSLTSNMLCAGYLDGDYDACHGDLGGPLVVNGVLAGIVSGRNGNDCASTSLPRVYTSILSLRVFIGIYTHV